jgi:WD40 repeat protein
MTPRLRLTGWNRSGDAYRPTKSSSATWDLDDDADPVLLGRHRGEIWCIAVSRDGERALTGSSDQSIGLWDLRSGRLVRRMFGI